MALIDKGSSSITYTINIILFSKISLLSYQYQLIVLHHHWFKSHLFK